MCKCTSPNDYLFTNKKWTGGVYSSFERVSSNHRIVLAKIYQSLCKNKAKTVKASHYDWSSLIKSDIGNHYMITVRNKFNTLLETSERHIWKLCYNPYRSSSWVHSKQTKSQKFSSMGAIEIREKWDNMKIASLIKETQQMPMPKNLKPREN